MLIDYQRYHAQHQKKPMKKNKAIAPIINQAEYTEILNLALSEIRTARASIALKVNKTANSLYWNLGKLLFEKQLEEGYGSGVVKQLSVDLKLEFPDMGLSPRNLWNMKRFYERYYQADTKLLRSVAVLPWGHNFFTRCEQANWSSRISVIATKRSIANIDYN